MSSSYSNSMTRKGSRTNLLQMSDSSRELSTSDRSSIISSSERSSMIIRSEGSGSSSGRKLEHQPLGKTSIPWLNSGDAAEVRFELFA